MGVADALVALGARPAEPGEFTRRAFLNGRMDLTEAEAVHDLIAAETEAQRRQALRQLDGALGTLYRGWAERLRLLLAQQEALIDFPDEDLPPEVEAQVAGELEALRGEVAAHLDDGRRGERLREGLVFAVTGRPNVGKSSLMNALAERDVAIVSAIPGTTRDALEARVVLGGVPVTLVDTAGLRHTTDEIEAEGVRRARARAAEADLVILVETATAGERGKKQEKGERGGGRGTGRGGGRGTGRGREGEGDSPSPCGRGLGGGGAPSPNAPSPQPPPARGGGGLDHPGCQQDRSRRRGSRRRHRRQRADRRGAGDAARPAGRGGTVTDRRHRTAAADPGPSSRGTAGSCGAACRRTDRGPAGTAGGGRAAGLARARAHYRQRGGGGHSRYAVRAVLHREVANACPAGLRSAEA